MNDFMVVGEPNWVALSGAWERSRLTQQKFCKSRGVSYRSFCTQRARLKSREKRAVAKSAFLPVSVEAEQPAESRCTSVSKLQSSGEDSSPAPEIEIELPFGVVLRFRGMVQQ